MLGPLPAALRSVRTVTLALALLIALMGLEGAIHSVHHLLEADEAGDCAIAAMSSHVAGTVVEPVAAEHPPLLHREPAVEPDAAHPAACPLRPDRGRAPPVAV